MIIPNRQLIRVTCNEKSPTKYRTQWQALVNQQSASGLSIANFCLEHKLSQSSFYQWTSTFRQDPKRSSRVSVKAPMALGKI
jgi:hypothetical protein